jgi:chemotaxis family two-component system response regulator Rcp1
MLYVLLAEDNPGDVLLIREALQEGGFEFELTVQQDGEKMLSYIDMIDAGERRCPDIVLLDLNLPKRNGDVLLKRMRSSGSCRNVPVIIVTSSDSKKDRDMAARLGASDYFRKANDFDEFMRLGAVVKRHAAGALR